MTTMRERLMAVAARTATVDHEGGYEVDNWPEVIDAILAELREPDEGMILAGTIPSDWVEGEGLNGKERRLARSRIVRDFTAMIDAVKSTKTTP